MPARLLALLFALHLVTPLPVCAEDVKPARLRILTYNIHHGEGTDGKFDLPRIAKVIKSVDPDLVALQEVDVKTKRASGVDQAAELGKLTGMHAVFGKAMNYSGGEYGEAVLSRWKIESSKNHALPHSKGREPRSAIEIRVKVGEAGPLIAFVGTHLDHLDDATDRKAQTAKLHDILAAAGAPPTILAGDLNAEPDKAEMKVLLENWQSAAGQKHPPTWPSDKPTVAIDYILLRPAKQWRVVEFKVIDEKVASDHRPVLAVVEMNGN